uniref:ATP synthase complex subunit 8 n=1 Tax=Himaloaesalus gaoligongshanus TaxID=2583518 RepID=A0A7L4VTF8_9SCAR|nr:ATP synthase subunit 8 [Himaloaesalus gaoligongshanus]QCU46382.1 ATP synthase F0 subunit 8 [Himaloaesalus gaoligongshanus]WQF69237.1 ATP synthase subunit 8 [Himaloaesalus gaoligongshanus]
MPQMAPMSWVLLMLIFVLSFMIFNSMNYFNFKYNPKTINFKKMKKTMNWKW